MTSVPKPLKFLRQHYTALKEVYETMGDQSNKVFSPPHHCVALAWLSRVQSPIVAAGYHRSAVALRG